MPGTTDKQNHENREERSALSRWLWFIGLYCAGLLAVAAVAWFFRALLGMH